MKYYEYNFDNKVKAITTTRELGNMAFQIGNEEDNVLTRRNELADLLEINRHNIVFIHQTHSDIILKVTKEDLGKGELDFASGMEGDALYTKEKGIGLGIFHADCEPVFFYDPTVPLVGIIHAGHPGTLKHIAYKALSKVIKDENLDPNNIKVNVGPLRRMESYEISDEDKKAAIEAGCEEAINGNHIDIAKSNYLDMLKAGILKENIIDCEIDTYVDERFYSAYKKTPVGRMTSIIFLK